MDAALAGEDIVIAKAGQPVLRLTPVEGLAPRRPGLAKGRITEAFCDLLPERELAAWEA